MNLFRNFAAGACAVWALTGSAQAEQADEILKRWTQYVDQSVEVDGCYLTYATQTNVYCDTRESRSRLYIDIGSIDATTLEQAIAGCPDWELRPECKVRLSGTLRPNFGSPMLYGAVGTFLQ